MMEQKNQNIDPQPRFLKSSWNLLSNYFDAIFFKKNQLGASEIGKFWRENNIWENIWICGVLEPSLSSASRICTALQQVIFFRLVNARKSGHERTMVWTWTHDGLDMNARLSGHERTKVWKWTHEIFSCVHVQTFVRSCPDHRAVTRPPCVHVQTIVRSCPDHRAFIRVSRPFKFERTTFISVWTYLVSVWHLSLGVLCCAISAAGKWIRTIRCFTENELWMSKGNIKKIKCDPIYFSFLSALFYWINLHSNTVLTLQ